MPPTAAAAAAANAAWRSASASSSFRTASPSASASRPTVRGNSARVSWARRSCSVRRRASSSLSPSASRPRSNKSVSWASAARAASCCGAAAAAASGPPAASVSAAAAPWSWARVAWDAASATSAASDGSSKPFMVMRSVTALSCAAGACRRVPRRPCSAASRAGAVSAPGCWASAACSRSSRTAWRRTAASSPRSCSARSAGVMTVMRRAGARTGSWRWPSRS